MTATSPKHSVRSARASAGPSGRSAGPGFRLGRIGLLVGRYVAVSMVVVGLTTLHSAATLGADFEGAVEARSGLSGVPRPVEVLGEIQVAVDPVLSSAMVEATNRDRVRNRRRPYVRTTELDAAAAAYAATLTSGRLVHSTDLSAGMVGRWSKLGENLGRGDDLTSIHLALMASPTHRANLLDSGFTQIGVAVIHTDVGLVVVQRFRQG